MGLSRCGCCSGLDAAWAIHEHARVAREYGALACEFDDWPSSFRRVETEMTLIAHAAGGTLGDYSNARDAVSAPTR